MSKKNPPKLNTTIDSFYKVKNKDISSFSKDDADLISLIEDTDRGIVYNKTTDLELSGLKIINSELVAIQQEMKKSSDTKKY